MKKIIITLAMGMAFSVANAQTPSTKPAPPTDQDVNTQDNQDVVFPPDVVDTTLDDTSDINDIKVDSTIRMEDKETFEKKEKTNPDKSKKK
jgi:hypothetical protein